MADREGRYRRNEADDDDDDDDQDDDASSGSVSSLSASPPPARKRHSPAAARERPERATRDRVRDESRYMSVNPTGRLPEERGDSPRMDRTTDRNRDVDRERDRDRDGARDRRHSRDPRDSRGPRDSWGPGHSRDPREPRHSRDEGQSPPPFSTKRQSITDRLRNSWNARKGELKGTPPPHPPNAAANRPPSGVPSRRSSSAGSGPHKGTTPIAKVREWLDTCNAEHGHHCQGTPATAADRPPSVSSDESDAEEGMAHGARRNGRDKGDGAGPSTFRPIWLIDAMERRLVRARSGDRYLALSYVNEKPHGPSPTARNAPRDTRRDNLQMLSESLDDADMPQAIADGIWLARKLGVKLLWVDRFCIVQDDDLEREEHLRNMAYVFANAYAVVVAAAGEGADTGLSALVRPGGRAPPPVPKGALGPPGRDGHEEMVSESRWRERCWTMQEGFYARRALYVFQDNMTWECHCETWNLAGDGPGGGNSPATAGGGGGAMGKVPGLQRVLSLRGNAGAPGAGRHHRTHHGKCTAKVYPASLGFRHPPWPDMDEYARICMEYASRRLGHPGDTLDAFRGFTTVLSKSFAGGFVFGMPVAFLDAALLWRPAATVRRRQVAPTIDSGGMNPVPSWSWMGWFFDGAPPDLDLWRSATDYVLEAGQGQSNGKSGGPGHDLGVDGDTKRRHRNVSGFRIRTTCQFHVTDRATTAPLRNDGWRFRSLRHQGSRKGGGGSSPPLPPGWSRSSTGGFRHDDDPGALFKYPVPLASDTPASELPLNGELAYPGTLLSFNTTRAFLEVDFAVPWPAKMSAGAANGIPLAVGNLLAPRSGRWVGTLRSHDAWLGSQGANYEGDERLELVAVSEGSERVAGGPQVGAQAVSDVWGPGSDMEAVRGHADGDGVVDFVNVLWVERVGGVCYRRGVGHVFLRAWEAFGRERVDVLLG